MGMCKICGKKTDMPFHTCSGLGGVRLSRCSCGFVAKVSVVSNGVWIECRLGDEGCMDMVFACDMDRAQKLWNETKQEFQP